MSKFQLISDILEKMILEMLEYVDENETDPQIQNNVAELYDIVIDIKEGKIEKKDQMKNSVEELFDGEVNFNNENLIIIAKTIIEVLDNICAEEFENILDDGIYNLKEIDSSIQINNCHYIDNDTQILYFDFSKQEKLIDYIKEIICEYGIDLILILLNKINIKERYDKLLLTNFNINEEEEIISFLKIIQVKQGKVIKQPVIVNTQNINSFLVQFHTDFKYNQFEDVIEILDEYNNHTFILDKYMRLYHIIENFMYRSQICILSKKMDYNIFSIREFKNMNSKLVTKELEALKKLVQAIAEIDYNSNKYKTEIFNKWKNTTVQSNMTMTEHFKYVLDTFAILKNGRLYEKQEIIDSGEDEVIKIFIELIYKFRCSIVHNKESEFHLSYNNLDGSMLEVLEGFMIPTLQDMIYYLILESNEVLWYDRRQLQLY